MCTFIYIHIDELFDYAYFNYVILDFQAIGRTQNSFFPPYLAKPRSEPGFPSFCYLSKCTLF